MDPVLTMPEVRSALGAFRTLSVLMCRPCEARQGFRCQEGVKPLKPSCVFRYQDWPEGKEKVSASSPLVLTGCKVLHVPYCTERVGGSVTVLYCMTTHKLPCIVSNGLYHVPHDLHVPRFSNDACYQLGPTTLWC